MYIGNDTPPPAGSEPTAMGTYPASGVINIAGSTCTRSFVYALLLVWPVKFVDESALKRAWSSFKRSGVKSFGKSTAKEAIAG